MCCLTQSCQEDPASKVFFYEGGRDTRDNSQQDVQQRRSPSWSDLRTPPQGRQQVRLGVGGRAPGPSVPTCCVTLGKSLPVSGTQFSHLRSLFDLPQV